MSNTTTTAPTFTSARNPNGRKKPVSNEAITNESQRVNVPFNAKAWDHVPGLDTEDRDELAWFHQHCLQRNFGRHQVSQILNKDKTNAVRILAGTYNVKNWDSIIHDIRSYRLSLQAAPTIGGIDIEPDFVITAAAARFLQGLDYASRGGFSIIAGPSGAGKTKTCNEWSARNPGRMIRINVPPIGGPAALVRTLSTALGMGRKRSCSDLLINLCQKISSRQVLVFDQGSRLIPSDKQLQAKSLEVLMDLNEATGCGIVIPLTTRDLERLGDLRYQIEQITGRAEIFAAPKPTFEQICEIAEQFGKFRKTTLHALYDLALLPGALRLVTKVLNLAERAARKTGGEVTDELIAGAIKNRFDRMGGEDPFTRTGSRS